MISFGLASVVIGPIFKRFLKLVHSRIWYLIIGKGGFKSEDTGEFLHLQHKYVFQISILRRKFEFPA
jgi:hypothetical protein